LRLGLAGGPVEFAGIGGAVTHGGAVPSLVIASSLGLATIAGRAPGAGRVFHGLR